MRQFQYLFAILVCSFVFSPAAFSQGSNSMQIKGSDTMVNLAQAWAEVYMEQDPEAFIAVTGGGSGTGIASIINGTCDIAQASRDISKKESEMAEQKGRDVQHVVVAIDAVAVIVHPSNPVTGLTVEQLSDIYTRKVTNWKDLGGKDAPILALSRERNSGTHIFVLEEVVRKGNKKGPEEFDPSILMMPSSQAIEQEVADNPAAIGYFGMGYLGPRVKAISIFNTEKDEHVTPTLDSVNDYPLARSLNFYLPRQAEGIVKKFIDFVLSEKGQSIVLDMDFVPLPSKSA